MKKIIFLLVSLLLLLAGCVEYRTTSFMFSGENENWTLSNYKIEIKNKELHISGGQLNMNDEDEFYSNHFSYEIHMVINGEDRIIQSETVTGDEINIVEQIIGIKEGEKILNKNGDAIRPNDIHQIYMIIEWYDPNEEEILEERFYLYDRKNKDKNS